MRLPLKKWNGCGILRFVGVLEFQNNEPEYTADIRQGVAITYYSQIKEEQA